MKLLKKDIAIVINRDGTGNNDVYDYCREHDIPVIARIPFSRKAAEMYSNGKMMTGIPEVRKEMDKVGRFILSSYQKIS
jgi:MinD superfamily P-loop ATPase